MKLLEIITIEEIKETFYRSYIATGTIGSSKVWEESFTDLTPLANYFTACGIDKDMVSAMLTGIQMIDTALRMRQSH